MAQKTMIIFLSKILKKCQTPAFVGSIVILMTMAVVGSNGQLAAALTMPGSVLGDSTSSAYAYPSGSVVNDNGTIYFINGTVKIPFTNYQAFMGLGYSLKNVIKGDLSNYTSAKTYFITTANAAHPWGSWLNYGGTVYYSAESGLIPVSSWSMFLNNGGQAKMIVKANRYDITALHTTPNLQLLAENDSRINSQQTSGNIQDSLLFNNNNPPVSTTTPPSRGPVMCEYPYPPAGFHYEGSDSATSCGKYLVKDQTVVNSSSTSSTVLGSLSPASGFIGAQITISATNFSSPGNIVNMNGVPLGIFTASSSTVSFNIPQYFSSPCNAPLPCPGGPSLLPVQPGNYTVTVTNAYGTSNSLTLQVLPASANVSACLPSGVTLDSVVSIDNEGANKVTVGQKLASLGAACSGTQLVDSTGKPIAIYQLVGCWGNPPTDAQQILSDQQQAIQNLNVKNTVITLTCNPSGLMAQ